MARLRTEEAFQCAVAQYLDLVLLPPAFFTCFPAGGGGAVRGARLKAMGLKPGMPDLVVTRPCSSVSTTILGLELKTSRGRVSPEQEACHLELAACGWQIRVCRSLTDVFEALEDTGFDLRPHVLNPGGSVFVA